MVQLPHSNADIAFLKGRLSVYDYAGGYHYLYDLVQKAIPNEKDEVAREQLLMTANWLISAKSINNVDGTWASEMVLHSMKFAVEQSGRDFTGATYKKTCLLMGGGAEKTISRLFFLDTNERCTPGKDITMTIDTREICIQSPRLSIEPFCEKDAVESFACITASLTRYMSWEPPASLDEYAKVWRQWLLSIADGSDFVFAIRQLEDARFTGLVGLHDTHGETPELGIWIREDRHGLGFGGEAVQAVVQWASQRVVANNFIYPVATDNHASRRIAEVLGGVILEMRTSAKYDSVVYQIPTV